MDLRVEALITRLKVGLLPDNGRTGAFHDSWGIGFTLTANLNPCIFSFHPILFYVVTEAQNSLNQPSDKEIEAKFVLDYKKGTWLLSLDYLSNDYLDNRYSMMIKMAEIEVRLLLTKALQSGLTFYDSRGSMIQ